MGDLNNDNNFIGINTTPILIGNIFLCIFCIIVNIIEISIILSLKFLHSILYRLLFIIAFTEIINCSFHIIQSIIIIFDISLNFFYNLHSFGIYFTDTLTMTLLTCLCDSMNALILKQNKKILTNQVYKIFSLSFASLLTIIYVILYLFNKNDIYIYSDIISWKFIYNEKIEKIDINSLYFISYSFTLIIYILLVMYCFYMIIKINIFIGEKSKDEKKSKNWAKLNEFKYKMLKYPFFGMSWVGPLGIYSLLEIINLNNNSKINEKLNILKIKYFLFFVFTFISSVRGILFFKLFISNEKIKKYIQYKIKNIIFFKNVLKDEISELIERTPSENESNEFLNKSGAPKNHFGIFQEGLIDDRDIINEKNENDSDLDSEEEEENISNKQEKNAINNNTMPENKKLRTLSSYNNDKDEKNQKISPLQTSNYI